MLVEGYRWRKLNVTMFRSRCRLQLMVCIFHTGEAQFRGIEEKAGDYF